MTDRFLICLPFTLAQECPYPNDWENPKNYSNDAHDPGGETWCGIIQREYDAWRKSCGLPCRDVNELTQEEGLAIYRQNYWMPHCPDLPPGLDLSYFDSSVNEGCTEATRMLQRILAVAVDGTWGSKTATAAANVHDVAGAVCAFTARRQTVYRMMPGFKYFGSGWTRRAISIGDTALKMAAGVPDG